MIWGIDLGKFLIKFSVDNLHLTFVTPGCKLWHQLPVKPNFVTVLGLPTQWLVGMYFGFNEKTHASARPIGMIVFLFSFLGVAFLE